MGRDFASDNNAGIHPAVLRAIEAANVGHARAYGDDELTLRVTARLEAEFGPGAHAFFVFGGTGANVTGLKAITQPHHAIVCTSTAHIHRDECGAPERFTGCKLLTVPTRNGKLLPSDVEPFLSDLGNEHHAQPRVVSIAQATELGTVYRPDELQALSSFCHRHGLLLHMDGARLANAAATLDMSLHELTSEVGADVLSLGGTKNGLLGGEAVLFLNDTPCVDFEWVRKQAMQLPSKMRYVAAQFEALLTDGLWRENAAQANEMATLLAAGLQGAGLEITQPVEANAVFVALPEHIVSRLQSQAYFYVWEEVSDTKVVARLMASFDTTKEDVEAFVTRASELLHS